MFAIEVSRQHIARRDRVPYCRRMRACNEHLVAGVDGAEIAVAEWPGSKGPLACLHGLTSHSRAFAGLATELPDYRMIAVDCRGRGRSTKEPPFGIEQHAADLAAVLDNVGVGRATLVGHSMGAFVAGAFTARHPDRVERLVFVDGGYPQDYPHGTTPEDLLESMLSVFLAKIRRTWASLEEYIAFYESTPVYRDGVDAYGRAHFAYDLTESPHGLRARVVEECIAPDWRDVLDHDVVGKRLETIAVPLLLIRAPEGLTGTGDAVITEQVRETIAAKVPQLRVVDLPGTNHHTILFSVAGARAVDRAIEEFAQ